ncbi:MAG: insulinase family protein [bacterium]|nr:insulinase family protein [Candidatus Minthenecus merdequi]
MRNSVMLFAVMVITISAWGQFGTNNPLPMDSDVRYGKLPNGLTYYVWHSEKPENRCDFKIAQKVGAILEEDHQNGLAHFLEHMCFNGTEHFPGRSIIEYFESIGVSFGGGINAYTSLEETVYRLSDVPTIREGIIDSALLVLYDWSCAISLLDEEIENERGVIREEWRTGNDAGERMWFKSQKILMPGTQYAKRDVIGDTAVINNFSHQALRDYYHKWYGPDLQAIIVVGDIDVDTMEQKIKRLFAKIDLREGMTPRTKFKVGDNEKPIVGVVLDKEVTSQVIEIGFKRPHPSDEYLLSYASYENDYKVSLINSCFSLRMAELIDDPECPFYYIGCGLGGFGGEKDAFMFGVFPKEGKEKESYRILCAEIERLRRYGITKNELETAKKEDKEYFEHSYQDRLNRKNDSKSSSCVRHFLDNDASYLSSYDLDKAYYDECFDKITVEELNAILADLIPEGERNTFIIANGMDKKDENGIGCDKCDMPSEEELLSIFMNSRKGEISASDYNITERPLVKKEPKPGRIVSRHENDAIGTTELMLSNNIKVIVKKTDNQKDNIRMSAESEGGRSGYQKADYFNAHYSCSIVGETGVGDFTPIQLSKQLTGKVASLYTYIGAYSEGAGGSSSIRDFETMLQLNWLYFTAPRKDDKRFESWLKDKRSDLEAEMSDPKNRYYKRMRNFMYQDCDRYINLDTNNIKQIDQKGALRIYKERFADPADFTFYFVGDIDLGDSAIVAAIEKWLGGMKTNKKYEKFTDDHYYVVKGVNYDYFKEPMTTKTATNSLYITGCGFEYNLKNILTARLIGNILYTRYLESIREKEGGSYGVSTSCSFSTEPIYMLGLYVNFDTDPDKQNHLLDIVYDEIEKIIAEGPLESDLNKEKEILIKNNEKSLINDKAWIDKLKMYYKYGINYFDEFDGLVNSITGEEIRQMLKKLYEQRNYTEVVMMPTR